MSTAPAPRLPLPEFIALLGVLTAITALSIDAMLPALPEITAELSPDDPNRAQLVVTSFVLGTGIGTFVVGPLSDALGRRPTILLGAILFAIGALTAWGAGSLEGMLAGRVIQGIGAAAPRIVSLALIRDLYAGRYMAQIMSFIMMIFAIIPALAPMLGSFIIMLSGWRSIFIAFILFAVLAMIWLFTRQPETLPPERRRPLEWRRLMQGAAEVLRLRVAQVSIIMQGMLYAMLFGTLSQIQQLFDHTYGRGDTFPYWFAGIALCSMAANLTNARLVIRWGMRRLMHLALVTQVLLSTVTAAILLAGGLPAPLDFALFLFWVLGVFATMGFTMGNINALAMEPLGHIAGMAASVISALATVIGAALAAGLGQTFDGTQIPLTIGVALLTGVAVLAKQFLPPATR